MITGLFHLRVCGHMEMFRADDAYKGGRGTADQGGYNDMELFAFMRPDQPKFDQLWFRLYVGISRADDALRRLQTLKTSDFPQKTEREAEMHFIRGHYYFLLKILFKHIPFFTADTPLDSLKNVSNVQYSSQQLWEKIANEFQMAVNNLPKTQKDVGRPTKYAAEAYLAKVRLYEAYVQDAQNNVTSINQSDLQDVVTLTTDVINSGQYGLLNNYGNNFLYAYDNSKESVWAVQRSINDGTPNGRVDMGSALNYPMNPSYGCCWFHIPSQNLVNAYKTGTNGLPEFTTYNNTDMKDSVNFRTNTVDPRLDYTVGIPGHPWKDDPTFIYEKSWARTPNDYGYYSSMKETKLPSCPCLKKVGPFYASSKNTVIIRYADVLLWKAEALIELGRQNEALPLINQVRQRALNSASELKYSNWTSQYRIIIWKHISRGSTVPGHRIMPAGRSGGNAVWNLLWREADFLTWFGGALQTAL